MATIKGVWVFNEDINTGSLGTSEILVNFTSNGILNTGMEIQRFEDLPGLVTYYVGYYGISGWAYSYGEWADEAYRTVDFGDTEQEVSNEFYAWLIANASEIITDLTNTTWYIPSGWSATAGYGQFSLNISSSDGDGNELYIGYYDEFGMGSASPTPDRVGIFSDGFPVYTPPNSTSFSFTVTGGNDVSNSTLIQWLTDNNAIQLKVTDLTNTTWTVNAGWEAEAEYGMFLDIGGSGFRIDGDLLNPITFYAIAIGYSQYSSASNTITFAPHALLDDGSYYANNYSFELNFTGGTDIKNPKLIAWLSKWGELQTTEEPGTSAIIKAGTYRFNDTLDFTSLENNSSNEFNINFTYPEDMSSVGMGEVVLECDKLTVALDNERYYIEFNVTNSTPSLGDSPVVWRVYREWEENHWFDSDINFTHSKIITVTADTTFTDDEGIAFATWFTENTQMLVKAGTYRFNKTLTAIPATIQLPYEFSFRDDWENYDDIYLNGNVLQWRAGEGSFVNNVYDYETQTWAYDSARVIHVHTPQAVSEDFYKWFNENTPSAATPIKKFTRLYSGDIVASSGGKCFKRLSVEEPQLFAPTIALIDTVLNIINADDNATSFVIYVDGEEKAIINKEVE